MKAVLRQALVIAALVALPACGSKSNPNQPPPPAAAASSSDSNSYQRGCQRQ